MNKYVKAFPLQDKLNSLLQLNGHSAALMPDLYSILIFGGETADGDNQKVYLFNLTDRTV